jgi:glutamate dehydrogenase/leucine dehydrogenase
MGTSPRWFEAAPIALDDLGPQRLFHYYDPRTGMRALLVIDTVRFGFSGGGVRMVADLQVSEVVRLARAMTYKLALLGLPSGGAKAGIWLDPADPSRGEVVRAFLEAIRPLTASGAFLPAPDMGTSFTDFEGVYDGSLPWGQFGAQLYEGRPLADQLSGYGVVVAAGVACELKGRALRGATVAIEGFGKAAAGTAKFFAREGARVVALSTVRRALYDPAGLDVETLLALQQQYGDAALDRYPRGNRLRREALFSLPVDVLVPGARPDVLHAGNVASVRAPLVVPVANIPYAPGIPSALAARGVIAIPDFVANGGGVLGNALGVQGVEPEAIFAAVRDKIGDTVRAVFAHAGAQQTSVFDAAVELARGALAASA